jgi:hypothetical protein
MQKMVFDQNIIYFFLAIIAVVIGIQVYLLSRIRNVLQALAMNSDTVVHYIRKIASVDKKARSNQNTLKTCQFCKHRLAYINTAKTHQTQEDFYHKCGLRNVSISLNDSCPFFEEDKETFQ